MPEAATGFLFQHEEAGLRPCCHVVVFLKPNFVLRRTLMDLFGERARSENARKVRKTANARSSLINST
jgi:hypothetical protein